MKGAPAGAKLAAGIFALALGGMVPAPARAGATLDEVDRNLKVAEERLSFVEKQYAFRAPPPEEEELRRRYSDAEIQYLLGNYPGAAVAYYDLLGSPAFKPLDVYPEAVFQLADSLYQEGNLLGARTYFREYLALPAGNAQRFAMVLARYLEASSKLNDFTGIEPLLERLKGPDGGLPPEVSYVYGKWMFTRQDLPEAERLPQAQAALEPIAASKGLLAAQALYVLGAIEVKRGNLQAAAERFEKLLAAAGESQKEKKVAEMASLALGRVYYEMGKLEEAVRRYQDIDADSPLFIDARFEMAWAYVKKKEYDKANQGCELLLLSAPDSTLAPEAKLLQGHLQLKLGNYEASDGIFNAVINDYAPTRDEMDAQLTVHADPVKYFDDLVAHSGEKGFEIDKLVPALAVKWLGSQQEVTDAVKTTSDLESGRSGLIESRDLAQRLIASLDTRLMQAFPALKEGFSRAESVQASLVASASDLLAREKELLGSRMDGVQGQLDGLKARQQELEAKFQSLPKSEDQLAARGERQKARVQELEKRIFQQGYQVESLFAILAAVEKLAADTKAERPVDPVAEREFADRIAKEREIAQSFRQELAGLRREMQGQKSQLGTAVQGEEEIRRQMDEVLRHEQELLAGLRQGLSADAVAQLERVDQLRARLDALKDRTSKAKEEIRRAVESRGRQIREKVAGELKRLDSYAKEIDSVSGPARNFVGQTVFRLLREVRQEVYQLVLKADVGIVDVAWTRKQDKTNKIQQLAAQKDRELKSLDEEFKDVLEEVK